MAEKSQVAKIALIVILLSAITSLIYFTKQDKANYQIFFREFYFIPIMLAGFWFGLGGAVATSVGITLMYLPFTIMNWRDFSASDLHRLMELVLYNAVALMLGLLRKREWGEQKRLREAERLAAMGKAMFLVAHEMKTPLIAIGGLARLVQRHMETGNGNPYRDKLDIVIDETRRLENMVNEMLDFSRPLELHQSEEDVRQLVSETIAIVDHLARERKLAIRTESLEELPPVSLDATRMKQVLINLVTNAIQASPEGQTVNIRSNIRGKELVIEVSDHGVGIPADKREEIFTPFFTTKKGGTGLGLSIVKKIVEAHHGRMEVKDNSESGVTFRVIIPPEPK